MSWSTYTRNRTGDALTGFEDRKRRFDNGRPLSWLSLGHLAETTADELMGLDQDSHPNGGRRTFR